MANRNIMRHFSQAFLQPLISDLPIELIRDFDNFFIHFAPCHVCQEASSCKNGSHLQVEGKTFTLTINLDKLKILKGDENPREAVDKLYFSIGLLFLKALFKYNRDVHPEVVQDKDVHQLLHAFVTKRAKVADSYVS